MAAIIVDQNPNIMSVDAWALVTNNVVINVILDTTQDMLSSPDLLLYDYVVDTTIQGQGVGVGYAYNPQTNRFQGPVPPPIDWLSIVVSDFDGISQTLLQTINDCSSTYGNLTPTQINNCFNAMLEDEQDNFTPNQLVLMQKILTYVLGGG